MDYLTKTLKQHQKAVNLMTEMFIRVDVKGQALKPVLFYMSQFLNLTENECLNILLHIRKNNKKNERKGASK